MTWRVHIEERHERAEIWFWVVNGERHRQSILLGPLQMTEMQPGEALPEGAEPLKFLDEDGDEFLRAFMDAAWERGLRPTGFEDMKNELTATRAHLSDMRAITAKKVGVDLS